MSDEARTDDSSSAQQRDPDAPGGPPPGQDSRVEDWMGQSVERDRELAEELANEYGPDEAERRFNEQATGRAEQEARHGSAIDPDQGQSAYRDPD